MSPRLHTLATWMVGLLALACRKDPTPDAEARPSESATVHAARAADGSKGSAVNGNTVTLDDVIVGGADDAETEEGAEEDAWGTRVMAAGAAGAAAASLPKDKSFNVVLILIDSLRWDMPWAGYPREIAPRLSRFAEEWALYPRSYSLSSYTAKSVVPLLVGKYPGEMLRDAYFFTRWSPDNVLITEMLQAAGHRTLAGHGHGYFLPGVGGVDQGFDDYRLLTGTFLDNTGVQDINSPRLNRLAKEILSVEANVHPGPGKRFFAYFHFLDPHYAYHKHPGHPDFGSSLRDVYDNEVHFTDKWVGDLVDFIVESPWGDETAIIITADHGEGFGERGRYRHAYEVWEALVRVPLLIRVPGAKPRRLEVARSHIDLAPTIAELMKLPPHPGFRGTSLVPEIFGERMAQRPILVDLPRCDLMDRRRAFVDGDWKLIIYGDEQSFELFDVSRDLREENDLSREHPERLAEMKRKFREFIANVPDTPVIGAGRLLNAPKGQRW